VKPLSQLLRAIECYKNAVLLMLIYIAMFSLYTMLLHYSFKTTMGDLGQYAQAFYKTIFEGKLFQMNNRISERNPSGSYFGEHFASILFLFLPIFALYPRPETLLVLKAVVGGLAILPLYALARDLTGSDKVATFISLAYVLNPHLFIARHFTVAHIYSSLCLYKKALENLYTILYINTNG